MTGGGEEKASRCEMLTVRGLRYAIRKWGPDDARPILFLHGTRDSSITFQFLVDHLSSAWCVIAPDWRGHGLSEWAGPTYWFHDFVADLDALVDALCPGGPIPIVAHSLGANIAGIYAGLRPDRLSHLVSLDGFGPLVGAVPVDARALMSRYLDLEASRHEPVIYPGILEMADRLRKVNPRLSVERSVFLAERGSREEGDGHRTWQFDPSQKMSLPTFHLLSEWGDIWSGMKAPVLWLSSQDKRLNAPTKIPDEMMRRAAMMPRVSWISIDDTGHNLHHDKPELIAGLIERFVLDADAREFPVFAARN